MNQFLKIEFSKNYFKNLFSQKLKEIKKKIGKKLSKFLFKLLEKNFENFWKYLIGEKEYLICQDIGKLFFEN